MIIGCDIDGVLADFNSGFIRRTIQVTGRDLFPERPFDIPMWNYPEHYGYTSKEVTAVWKNIKLDTNFWATLPAFEGTMEFLFALEQRQDEGDGIYFVTARPGVEAKHQTERWLRCHGFRNNPTVLISSAKGKCAEALDLDAYIDDRWENVVDVAGGDLMTSRTQAYLLVRPWNRNRNPERYGIREVTSVAEFLSGLVK